MISRLLQGHQVDDIDHPDLQLGNMFTQDLDCGQRFQCRDIAATCHHDIGFRPLVVTCPLPDTDTGRAMPDGFVHRQILQGRLFAGNNHIDTMPAPQAVIGH